MKAAIALNVDLNPYDEEDIAEIERCDPSAIISDESELSEVVVDIDQRLADGTISRKLDAAESGDNGFEPPIIITQADRDGAAQLLPKVKSCPHLYYHY